MQLLAQVQGLEVRKTGPDMGVSLCFMGEVRRNVRLRDESFWFLRCWFCEGNENDSSGPGHLDWVLALGSPGEDWWKS